jgi:hypothetical protein
MWSIHGLFRAEYFSQGTAARKWAASPAKSAGHTTQPHVVNPQIILTIFTPTL